MKVGYIFLWVPLDAQGMNVHEQREKAGEEESILYAYVAVF